MNREHWLEVGSRMGKNPPLPQYVDHAIAEFEKTGSHYQALSWWLRMSRYWPNGEYA